MFRWLSRLFHRPARLLAHPLLAVARSANQDARRRAAEELGSVPEAWAIDELFRLLMDVATPVREAAVAAIRRQGAAAVPALVRGLVHPRVEVGTTSAELIGSYPSTEVVERLLVTLKYAERPVQLAARRSLGRCGPVAVPALRAALSETQPWVRAQITLALAEAEAAVE